jgi:hypothetical protein
MPHSTNQPGTPPPSTASDAAQENPALIEAQKYMERIRRKMEKLAEDFAAGKVNSIQFNELYDHYQKQRKVIEAAMEEAMDPNTLRQMDSGESMIIRLRHTARLLSYAIYLKGRQEPLRIVGEQELLLDEPALESMLDRFHSGEQELNQQEMHNLEIENGRWIGFFPGQYSILVALFSLEPARLQLEMWRDVQSHFEMANKEQLAAGAPDLGEMVFPHTVVFTVRSKS